MKAMKLFALAAMVLGMGSALQAEEAIEQTQSAQEMLSAQELAFASKLNEQNRKAFAEKFSADQRQAAMIASGHVSGLPEGKSMSPDEAIQMLESIQ